MNEKLMTNSSRSIISLLAVCALGVTTYLTMILIMPPEPLPVDAPATEFSAGRAIEDLAVIAREPHPMGEFPARVAVRDYLLAEIRSLGLEPEVQKIYGVRVLHSGWVIAGAVENVLVRLPGLNPDGALLLMSHYDSTPGAPGAVDSGSGVVAVLEILRALQASSPIRQDVIFLLTDGEEPGTIGAHAFVSQHPWFDDVMLAINLEQFQEGPPVLVRTNGGNSTLIQAFSRTSVKPAFISLPYDLFPGGDTDLVPFFHAGMRGAEIQTGARYPENHTMLDRVEVVNHASLQQGGSQILALVRYLGDQPKLSTSGSNDVFFPILGKLVHYPTNWAVPLAIVATLAFFVVLGYGIRAKKLTWRGTGLGLLAIVLVIVLSIGITSLLWLAIQALHPEYGYSYAFRPHMSDDYFYVAGFSALALAITTSLLTIVRKVATFLDLAAGVMTFLFLVTLASAYVIPATSYVATGMLLTGSIALGIGSFLGSGQKTPGYVGFGFLVSAMAAIFLLVPIMYIAYLGPGLTMLWMLMALVAVALGAMMPILDGITNPRRWLLPIAALLVGVGFLVAGHFLVGKDTSPPLVNPVGYWLDAGEEEAYWIGFSEELDERQRGLLMDPIQRPYTEIFPEAPHYSVITSPAPKLEMAGPRVEVIKNVLTDGRRVVQIKIKSSMQDRVYVIVPGEVSVLSITIPHNEKIELAPNDEEFVLRFDGTPFEGFDVTFDLDNSGQFPIYVVEEMTGLPSFPGLVTRPRAGTMSSPGEFYQGIPTDFTAIYRAFIVPGPGG